MEDEYITMLDFAKATKVHYNTVRKAILMGLINAINIGTGKRKHFRIPKSEIQRLSVFSMKDMLEKIKEEKK